MGVYAIKMPDIGESIAEVELVEWRIKAGDEVKEDQVVADVMTDKATVEIPSPVAGKVLELGGQPGQLMAVGAELVRIEVVGEGNMKAGAAAPAKAAAAVVGVPPDKKDDITRENAAPSDSLSRERERAGVGVSPPPQSPHPNPLPQSGEGARQAPPAVTPAPRRA